MTEVDEFTTINLMKIKLIHLKIMRKIKYLTLISGLFLVACVTDGNHRLDQSLQHYGGQIADQVRSQLDLNKMGFKATQEPTQTAELLSYTIVRDMNIPMGTPNISPSISMGAPMPPPQMGGL